MRRNLSWKGRAFLVAGTLCVLLGAVGWSFVVKRAGPTPDLAHFALGLLFGLGMTLNIAAWFVEDGRSAGARAPGTRGTPGAGSNG